jgi:dephospho-CoA kinase
MLKIGLTGGIGCGKTTVAKMFSCLGIPVYNSDIRAKAIMQEDEQLKEQLVQAFGERTFDSGKLNRPFLAALVFSDEEELQKLNAIVHPAIQKDFDIWASLQNATYIIKEAAILFESGANRGLDKVILVEAPEDLRIERVLKRDAVTKEEVRARISKQWTDSQKKPLSDFVIMNNEKSLLLEQVLKVHEELINND